ncbi:MAG TPA: transglutaminase-like domain-containing protein [Spirochaetota bacterium]|nr:transglutaminase-like domain-containing protein [Spirochaetota bacterium]HOL57753.1 transglutaminase-like domain-containing protein [Spirochaetota bacterium]HPP04958.1 transglutaminase-like domain-containing protein [Spirochaetota bacterium]
MFKKVFLFVTFLVNLIFILFLTSSKGNILEEREKRLITFEPEEGYYGSIVSIRVDDSINIGNNRVIFGDTECKDYDFDYISYSNNEIKVKVPTGARSGKIKLILDNEVIESDKNFKILNENSRIYYDPMDLTIDYTLIINMHQNLDTPLYVWLPSAVPSDTQRDVSLISKSGNYFETQNNMLDLFILDNVKENREYYVSKKFSYTSYAVRTIVNEDEVFDSDYDRESEFYKYYTSPEYGVESDSPQIIELAKTIAKDEKNPYKKARLFYDWVIKFLDYQYPPPNRDWRAISALKTGRGDCAVYSFLFTALCRASGIPARPIAGHVLFKNNIVSMHFWAEFYIPKYGWIPVDANYGDCDGYGFEQKNFYFGNMDNRHIGFSKGIVNMRLPDFNKNFNIRYLQKFHIYSRTKLSENSYTLKRVIVRVME